MALSMRTVIFSLVVLVALLTIPIMIGVYVYRDAKRRGANTASAMSATGTTIMAIRILPSVLSLCRWGGAGGVSTPSSGAAHLGHTFQSASTGNEQFGQAVKNTIICSMSPREVSRPLRVSERMPACSEQR